MADLWGTLNRQYNIYKRPRGASRAEVASGMINLERFFSVSFVPPLWTVVPRKFKYCL